MQCNNCQHQQSTGKFCVKCGSPLIHTSSQTTENVFVPPTPARETQNPTVAATIPSYQTTVEPNLHVEKVKETSKQYWSYFIQHLKKPSTIFNKGETHFINGIISMVILALFTSLALYKNISVLFKPFSSGNLFETDNLMPSFFKIFFSTSLTIGALALLSMTIIYLVTKFFGTIVTFKHVVAVNGALTVPFILLAIIAYILLLIDSLVFGNALLFLSIIFSLFIMPLYVISNLLSKESNYDSFYGFLSYIVLFAIGFSIVSSIFIDSTVGQYITQFQNLFGGNYGNDMEW